jgi:hypothetical protein
VIFTRTARGPNRNNPFKNKITPLCENLQKIILPLASHEREIWSVTRTKEQKLRVFENWMLRKILGPKWNEITGEWQRIHNEEFQGLYSTPNITRVIG